MSDQDEREDGQDVPPEPETEIDPGRDAELDGQPVDDLSATSAADAAPPSGELAGEPEVEAVRAAPAREHPLPASIAHRRRPRRVLPLVVATALGAILVVALNKYLEPDPVKLFAAAVEQYQNAQAMEIKGETTTEVSFSGMQQKLSSPIKVAFQKPNLFAMEQGSDLQHSVTISDGQTIYSEIAIFKMVLKVPAPKDLTAMSQANGMSDTGQDGGRIPSVMNLASGGFVTTAAEVTAGLDPQDPWLAGLPAIPGALPVTVKSADGQSATVWIDRRSKLIQQVAMRFDGSQMTKDMDSQMAASGMGGGMVGQMAEMMKTMSTLVVSRYTSQTINPDLAAERFAYQPPAGFKVIEADALDPSAMIEAMMGSVTDMLGELPGLGQLKGKAPTDFTARTLDGQPVKFSSLKGKPVVLEFWATTCGPSRDTMPVLNDLYRALKDQGLQVVAVSNDTTREAVEAYLKEHPVDFTVWWLEPAEAAKVADAYGVIGVPRSVYIGRDGSIKGDTVGLRSGERIKQSIGELGLDVSGVKVKDSGTGKDLVIWPGAAPAKPPAN